MVGMEHSPVIISITEVSMSASKNRKYLSECLLHFSFLFQLHQTPAGCVILAVDKVNPFSPAPFSSAVPVTQFSHVTVCLVAQHKWNFGHCIHTLSYTVLGLHIHIKTLPNVQCAQEL